MAGNTKTPGKITPAHLTCNGLAPALGIPRSDLSLAWQVAGEGYQQSYQIILAGTPEKARKGRGDLYDSGQAVSGVCNATLPLPECGGNECWWTVRVWDGDGRKSEYALPQRLVFAPDEGGGGWQAEWILDPGIPGEAGQAPAPNSHSYFRKTFQPRREFQSAICFVTGDDYYKLYLNGQFVGQGPSPAYLDGYYFNTFDVTSLLAPGQSNTIAVHAYYQGLNNRVWVSDDGKTGMILQMEVTYTDGSQERVCTDGTWRVQTSGAYSGETTGYKTQFLEYVDGRRVPWGWTSPEFNDSTWPAAVSLGPPPFKDRRLIPQPTPALQIQRIAPSAIRKLSQGRFIMDFGKEVVGTTGWGMSAPAGHIMEILHGEEMAAEDSVRYELRANCNYRDTYTFAGRPDEMFELFDYKAFRYVELRNAPEAVDSTNVWVTARHYPFDPERASFECSDTLLQAIWDLCRYSVQQGSQEVYVDCPTREKGQYLGDTYIEGLSHFYAAGELLLQRKALRNFAESSAIAPTLLCVAPAALRQEIADYSFQWVLFLEEFYRHSGDLVFLEEMYPVMMKLLEGFREFENEQGLLKAVPTWNLVDWPKNLRDGYDMEAAEKGVNTVLNAFYVGALEAASRIAAALRLTEDEGAYGWMADRTMTAMNDSLIDATTGLFVDALGSDHSSLHANVLPLYFGFAPADRVPGMLDLVARKRMACGVYFSAFVLRALYRNGAADLAFDLLTSQDEHSWANMLRHGATTTLEAWGPDLKWNTSWCHAWATTPIFIIAEEVMGLRPSEPGWARVTISPKIPEGLDYAALSITTPRGPVAVAYRREGERLMIEVETPGNVEATFMLMGTRELRSLLVDGDPSYGRKKEAVSSFPVTLTPGRHIIEARLR